MTLPRWIAPGAIAFLVIWLVLLAGGRDGMLRDPGTFWHTRTGEVVLQEGFIRVDPYTFTFGGTWWVPYQWLGEVGMALTYKIGGFDAQLLIAVTLLASVFAWLAIRLLNTGLNFVVVGSIVALGIAAAGSHFHVRPHLFTLASMAVTAVLLVECDRGRIPLTRLFWLIPLFIVWTNVHGGMLGGLATLFITCAGWFVFWQVGMPSPINSWRKVGLLALLAIGCSLSMLVNPYGTDMVKTWRIIMDEPLLKEIIVEHRSLAPAEPYAWPIIGFAAVYLFVLVGVRWRAMHFTWLLPLVWLLETIDRCRHASLFVVVTLVAIAAMWPATRWAARLASTRRDFYDPDTPPVSRPLWASLWLPAGLVIGSLALIVGGISVPIVGAGWARHDSKLWPVELLDEFKANEPKSAAENRLFTDYMYGGFAIFHAPGYKVFVDDRCEVFGGAWLKEFIDSGQKNTETAISRWEKEYGQFNFALTKTGTGFDDYFKKSPNWQCLKSTDTAAFYRRK